MAKYKVLITDSRHPSIENERAVLEPLGVELVNEFCSNEDELIKNGKGAIGMLVTFANVSRRVMEALPELKIIVRYGVGYDTLDPKAAAELGKYTVNVPDYCTEEVALHALALAMEGLRRVYYYSGKVKSQGWTKEDVGGAVLNRPSQMCAGIVGIGRIGRAFAAYIKPVFGKVKYYDPFVDKVEGLERCNSLEELMASCDLVSVHTPLNESTRNLISKKQFDASKKGLMLVNTARAGMVNKSALVEALDSGQIGFFGADVWWEEPMDYNNRENVNLVVHPNVVVTPHVAWLSEKSSVDLRRLAAMEIARVIKGEKPLHVVS